MLKHYNANSTCASTVNDKSLFFFCIQGERNETDFIDGKGGEEQCKNM